MRLRWLLALLPVGLMLVAVAGCGDGDGDGDGDGGQLDEADQELLEQILLAPDDLPAGMQVASASFSTNRDVADALLDPDAELAKLERWGRRLGYDVQFEPGVDAPVDLPLQGLQNTASLYTTSQGASDSFAEGIRDARETDWPALYPGIADLNVQEVEDVEGVRLADEAVWFRISGFNENGTLLVDDQVAIRVGSVRGFLRAVTVFEAGTERDAYLDQIDRWVRRLVERIEAGLAQPEATATATATP
jgi:hypothetical protein